MTLRTLRPSRWRPEWDIKHQSFAGNLAQIKIAYERSKNNFTKIFDLQQSTSGSQRLHRAFDGKKTLIKAPVADTKATYHKLTIKFSPVLKNGKQVFTSKSTKSSSFGSDKIN